MIYSKLNCLLECSKSAVKVLQLYNPKDTWFRKITEFTKVWLQQLSFYPQFPLSSFHSFFMASEIKQ